MKKKLFLLAFAFLAAFAPLYSQRQKPNTERGIFFLKGGTNGRISFEDGTPFTINVGAGFFPLQNFLVGADLGYEKAGPFDDFYARPFARYYAFRRVFGGVGLSATQLTGGKPKYIPDVEAGFALFLDSSLAFEPTFHYPITENSKPYVSLNVSIFFSRF